ncbi:MAG TPA: glycosyltransferase [Acidobacteriota bacterium]|nr:glycosyltransferase [Acidobacteriota bacterium]
MKPEPGRPFLVAQVAPYPPQLNGIGDCAYDLCRAIRQADPGVSTLALACRVPGAPEREPDVWRCWDPRSDWPPDVLRAIDEVAPQIVHVQHGMYMGHGRRVARFLEGLKSRRIPIVVTLHGVWPAAFARRWPRRFHATLAEFADRVMIHQRAGALPVLLEHGVQAERITVIPLGTADPPVIDRARARDKLGLTREPIVLFAGLIFRRKGLHTAVRAFRSVSRDVPGACLLAVGRERTAHPVDGLYRLWLRGLMRRGRKAGWIDFRPGHASEEDLSLYIGTADVVVMPYLRPYGSSSAIFHRALAAGRPVLCSNVPTFAEAIEAWAGDLPGLIVPPGDVRAWAKALTLVLTRPDLRERAACASFELGLRSRWPSVAGEHIRMYRTLLGG